MTGPASFGPYLLLDRLGAGGMGGVYLARRSSPAVGVPPLLVIKRMHEELSGEAEFAERFVHEAKMVAAIDSPHVVRIYDAGRVDRVLYIAMEYVAGWPFSRILQDLRESRKPASLESVIELAEGALLGLEALHSARDAGGELLSAVHRDISPKNIMVGEDGVVRLIDLGLGKSRLQAWKTRTGAVMGSPGYMSPEQVLADPVDRRSDIYSMGIVIFELLTLDYYVTPGLVGEMLRAPLMMDYRPPSSIRPEARIFDPILERAIAREPERRFQSAAEFRAALREVFPARDRVGVNTVIGEMLWGERVKTRTDISRLLIEQGYALEATVLRSQSPAPSVAPAEPTGSGPPPAIRSAAPARWMVWVAIAAAVPAIAYVAIVLGLGWNIAPEPVPAVVVPLERSAVPVARPIAVTPAVEPARPLVEELEAPRASAARGPPVGRSTKSARAAEERPEPAAVEEPAPTEAAPVSLAQRIDSLTERALALRKRHARGTAIHQRASDVLTELLQIRVMAVPESEEPKVKQLESELRRLEESGD